MHASKFHLVLWNISKLIYGYILNISSFNVQADQAASGFQGSNMCYQNNDNTLLVGGFSWNVLIITLVNFIGLFIIYYGVFTLHYLNHG